MPASPTSAPSASPIPVDSIATVVTDDLRVRSKPEVSDSSELRTPLLDNGHQVFVVDGPVSGSGYDWYLVAPMNEVGEQGIPFGWVAAADKTGEPWLAAGGATCPDIPDSFTDFAAIPSLVALACFGDTEISFAARVVRPEATCGVDPGWAIVPDWLGDICYAPEFIVIDPTGTANDFESITEPGVDASGIDAGVTLEDAVDVVITGHHDHEDSGTCEVEVFEGGRRPTSRRSRRW